MNPRSVKTETFKEPTYMFKATFKYGTLELMSTSWEVAVKRFMEVQKDVPELGSLFGVDLLGVNR
jgi:hypothetical protein